VLAAALISSLVLSLMPAGSALTSAAGVPVTCVDDATWSASFPAALSGAHGIYDGVNHDIYLRQIECARLDLLVGGARSSNVRRQYEFASAVFLFAHEIAHAHGIDDEALADCAAGRSFLTVAAELGIGRGYARLLTDYLVNARIPSRCYPA
jgi:hypothetical protein